MKRIKFKTAKLAKDVGFESSACKGIYWKDGYFDHEEDFFFHREESYPAPYQCLLQKWLRKNHNIHISIIYIDDILGFKAVITTMKDNTEIFATQSNTSYEEAQLECLRELIKICKK